ncbi:LysR family transcriptional regulator [Plesiomonas shigelloides]|uniref:LysR family transcriptional regulator n=1 Tax=Plesiomonas shigelloides TaxID=703 RepID=UPI0028882756|nr:LysR family transcriptional regulator [Plesiomonas shigelloides]MDT1012289.1 LysR family transcriptional regulator [Plesiomonas shigelloides]
MDYRLLRAFTAVFEEKNMTAAAQRCHVSQPALSASIRQLEEQLNVTLFIRQPKGVALTDEARRLYPSARRLVNELQNLPTLFAQQGGAVSLSVGLMADLGQYWQSQLIAECYAALPGLQLTLLQGCAGDMRIDRDDALCDDDLFFPLLDDAYHLAVSARHPFAQQVREAISSGQSLTLADVPAQEWLACHASASYQRIMGVLSQHSLVLTPKGTTDNHQQLAAMLNAGLGIGLLPQSLLADWPTLLHCPVPELALSRRIGWCYSVEAARNPAVQQIIQHFTPGTATDAEPNEPESLLRC